jgi:hypothetical protein
MKPRWSYECLAVMLIVSLPWVAIPASAAEAGATLSGSIVRSEDGSPLAGAKLHANDPKTGKIFSSRPATDEGAFELTELPPSTYALAVESNGGLYLVEAPLQLAPGATRTVNLAVTPQNVLREGEEDDDMDEAWGFMENPLTATLIVLGTALVAGVALDNILDDDDKKKSPSAP